MGAAAEDFVSFATVRAPSLFRTAYALCGDWYFAQDLVQDVLLLVHLRWDRVAGADNPVGYVNTMLVRTFLSQARRRRFGERPLDPMPDRVGTAVDLDLNLVLMTALGELSPKDRAVLVLRYLEDQTVEQVASELRCTSGAVRVRSMRALRALHAVLGVDPSVASDPTPTTRPLTSTKEGQ